MLWRKQSGGRATRGNSPCRGTGHLTSKLGGEPHDVSCPWCEGTGTFIPEHDAQAARRDESATSPPPPE